MNTFGRFFSDWITTACDEYCLFVVWVIGTVMSFAILVFILACAGVPSVHNKTTKTMGIDVRTTTTP